MSVWVRLHVGGGGRGVSVAKFVLITLRKILKFRP